MAPGQTLLVLAEDPQLGYYDSRIAGAVIEAARGMGLHPLLREVAFTPDAPPPDAPLLAEMGAADRVLFLARLGDQLRFDPAFDAIRPVVSYALDAEALRSDFGRAHHHAFEALKYRINTALASAHTIRVTCPLGTDFSGPGAPFPDQGGEVGVTRFPMAVFAPVPAAPYAGVIAQAGFLIGTGSRYYDPYALPLDDVLRVHVDGNRILGFDGTPADVDRAARHYREIGARFGIDWAFVHSWHAGIHPGCAFAGLAGDSPERWSGSAFGSPRVLHFHTCGAYAPGEISLNVIDPTVTLDGVKVWDTGRLHPDRIAGGVDILAQYPCAAAAFAAPPREIGLGPNGRLTAPAQAKAR